MASSGEKIDYRFTIYQEGYDTKAILSEVEPPHAPKIQYSYEHIDGKYKRNRISRKSLPDNRALQINYHATGKVKELVSPAGRGNQLIATHSFDYYSDGDKRFAEVRNALGGLKTYQWNKKQKRLNAIKTYDNAKHLILKERFLWGDTTCDLSHLTARTLEDGNNQLISYQKYQYDPNGNLLSLVEYGNLTGKHRQPIINIHASHPPRETTVTYIRLCISMTPKIDVLQKMMGGLCIDTAI